MIKKTALFIALSSAVFASGGFSGAGSNQSWHEQGGFVGKGSTINVNSIKEALNLRDDSQITLISKIRSQIKPEHYEFVDQNGDIIEIEIDHDEWSGITADESTLLEIYGEIDKDFTGTSIDVKRVRIAK